MDGPLDVLVERGEVDHESQFLGFIGNDLDDDQKGCWWSGVEMDRSHWWQGMDRRDCQTRTANDVPNVPVNLALSSN